MVSAYLLTRDMGKLVTSVMTGRRAMRISVSSWATTDADVEKSLDAILRVANKRLKH